MTTNYDKQIEILNEVWYHHRDEEQFFDFVDFNDVGLPLAHLIHKGIIQSTPMAEELVRESFGLLLALFNINDDTGFDSLSKIMQ